MFEVVGRGEEMEKLKSFIRSRVENKASASLYISGLPGTGKTMCVKKAVESAEKELDFRSVWVNCMNLTSAGNFYNVLCELLDVKPKKRSKSQTPSKYTAKDAEAALVSGKTMILLCLDEIDQLQQGFRSLLLRVFEWPCLENSNVILIGIANSFDLADRCLNTLGLRKEAKPQLLHFLPYTTDEIVAIVKDRLLGFNKLLSPEALELCARKCAAVAGDVRKALETCKLTVERASYRQTSGSKTANTTEVLASLQDVYASTKRTNHCVCLPLQQKLLFAAAFSLSSANVRQFSIDKLLNEYKRLCSLVHIPAVETTEIKHLCELLESYGLLRRTKKPRFQDRYTLEMADADAREIINDDRLLSALVADNI